MGKFDLYFLQGHNLICTCGTLNGYVLWMGPWVGHSTDLLVCQCGSPNQACPRPLRDEPPSWKLKLMVLYVIPASNLVVNVCPPYSRYLLLLWWIDPRSNQATIALTFYIFLYFSSLHDTNIIILVLQISYCCISLEISKDLLLIIGHISSNCLLLEEETV